jgi:hypothetical protein
MWLHGSHTYPLYALEKDSIDETIEEVIPMAIGTSKWIKTKSDDYSSFYWQDG